MATRKLIRVGEVFPSAHATPPTLTAVEPCRLVASGVNGKKKAKVRCRCSCGKEGDYWAYNLRNGHTRSCGCHQADARRESYRRLHQYRKQQAPKWTMRRMRTERILRLWRILDERHDDEVISQRDRLPVACTRCGWLGKKAAVEIERHPESCQRCAGKEQWSLCRVRTAISGKRLLLDSHGDTEDTRDGSIRLRDVRKFRCLHCGNVLSSTIMTAVRLKTRYCRHCKPDRRWTLGDFRSLVAELGGRVLGLKDKPDTHPIRVRQKISVACSHGHVDKKHACHVSQQRTLCQECSIGLYERIVRAHFQSMFGVPFPTAHPEWLVNPRTGYPLELDGYAAPLALAFEHDGPHHNGRAIRSAQGPEYFRRIRERDALKDRLCVENGVCLVRIPSLGDIIAIDDLRSFILHKCGMSGVHVPFPNAPIRPVQASDTTERFHELIRIVEQRGGRMLSKQYLGTREPLTVACGLGHRFRIRVSHLKDEQFRWCRRCYAQRLRDDAARRHGHHTYRDRLVAILAKAGCSLLTHDTKPVLARTAVTVQCRCGDRRTVVAGSAVCLKGHGRCRKCSCAVDRDDSSLTSPKRLDVGSLR